MRTSAGIARLSRLSSPVLVAAHDAGVRAAALLGPNIVSARPPSHSTGDHRA